MRNETDVCRGAFWVICLIQDLMGSEGIKRLKQLFLFFFFLHPRINIFTRPRLGAGKWRNSRCLLGIFSLSGSNSRLNPHLDCAVMVRVPTHTHTIPVKQKQAFLRGPLLTYDLRLPRLLTVTLELVT